MRRLATMLVGGLAVLGATACGSGDADADAVDVDRGRSLFANNCAVCHGPAGDGTLQGPPLVHEIYEPGHHPDELFQVAVAQGVQAHHWDFGPMPAIGGLDRGDVEDITAYVRQLQREAGIIE
jgi:mono/diheme cytochrome c family protein